MYDVAVIGAGINGCSIAHELTQSGKTVALIDMESIAGGGSGAAGAFISPKFSKAGELKELLHEAFIYSMKFYEENFPSLFQKTPLLHLAQDEKSSQTLKEYKNKTDLELLTLPDEFMKKISKESLRQEYISLEAGLVDAEAMCQALSKGSEFIKQKVETLEYKDGTWQINSSVKAKSVVLATGAYEKIIQEPYIQLRGVWGHRIDVRTTTSNPYSIHQYVSISSSKKNTLAIGATHNVHYHPQSSQEVYDYQVGREELLQKARKTVALEDVEVIKDYTGLRSGSFDYIPIIGNVVDSSTTLKNKALQFKVKNPDISKYSYYPDLYMINGSGGYGFVFAPYLAKILKENIVDKKDVNPRLQAARFFSRWMKKKDVG